MFMYFKLELIWLGISFIIELKHQPRLNPTLYIDNNQQSVIITTVFPKLFLLLVLAKNNIL